MSRTSGLWARYFWVQSQGLSRSWSFLSLILLHTHTEMKKLHCPMILFCPNVWRCETIMMSSLKHWGKINPSYPVYVKHFDYSDSKLINRPYLFTYCAFLNLKAFALFFLIYSLRKLVHSEIWSNPSSFLIQFPLYNPFSILCHCLFLHPLPCPSAFF